PRVRALRGAGERNRRGQLLRVVPALAGWPVNPGERSLWRGLLLRAWGGAALVRGEAVTAVPEGAPPDRCQRCAALPGRSAAEGRERQRDGRLLVHRVPVRRAAR